MGGGGLMGKASCCGGVIENGDVSAFEFGVEGGRDKVCL